MMRFLNTFVGTIEEDRKLDRHVLEGAPGEWGMIDGGIESDGKEWIDWIARYYGRSHQEEDS